MNTHSLELRAGFLVLLLAASGCSVYRVKTGDGSSLREVPGVPFYVMSAQCRQQTVYQEDVRRLTLQVREVTTQSTSAVAPGRVVLTSSKLVRGDHVDTAVALREQVQRQHTAETLRLLIRTFDTLPAFEPKEWKSNPILVLVFNETAPLQIVDYSNKYYFNGSQPIIGSSTITATLNPNGTLATGTATVDDRTVETLLGLFPIKEELISRWIPEELKAQLAADSVAYHATLTVEAAPVLHTLTRMAALDRSCPQSVGIPPGLSDDGNTAYARSSAAAAKPATPANAISVSGQVTMPEKKP